MDPINLYTISEASRALGIPLSRIRRNFLRGSLKPFALSNGCPLFRSEQLTDIARITAQASTRRILSNKF